MPDNKDIIHLLEKLAVLLELSDTNPFKIRAIRNAARTLRGREEDLARLALEGRLTAIKGIGKGIAETVREYISDGKSRELEELQAALPAGLPDLLRIPGLGTKKIRTLWKQLGITSIGELEYACRENRLLSLDGFGEKSQEKVLEGIELLKKFAGQWLLSAGWMAAEEMVAALRELPGVLRCEIAGNLRRHRETIRDIRLVLSVNPEKQKALIAALEHVPLLDELSRQNNQHYTAKSPGGIPVNIYITPSGSFPVIWLQETGNDRHLTHLKPLIEEQGLSLDGKNPALKDEEDIYRALGLPPIPPPLREGDGEVEAAAAGTLPRLITTADLQGVIHTHTRYSDGANSIREMANHSKMLGYRYLVVSDHSRTAAYANGLSIDRVREQFREIDALNTELQDFCVLKSIESDILPDGSLDYPDEFLAEFDLVIGSIHSGFRMSKAEATARLLRALENPLLSILGHPTGRLLLAREGYQVDMEQVLRSAAANGVAVELNANPHRLDIDWHLLRRAKDLSVRISINPDAHRLEGIEHIRYGVMVAQKGWLEPGDVLNCLSADELLRFTHARRMG